MGWGGVGWGGVGVFYFTSPGQRVFINLDILKYSV